MRKTTSSTGRWHFDKTTGTVNPCDARIRCPLGDMVTEHFGSPDEASAAYQAIRGTLAVQGDPRTRSLKSLDAHELAHELFQHVETLGFDEGQFHRALTLASVLHSKQRRRNRGIHSRTPYIEHPLRASLRLLRSGVKDPATVIIAVLHDTLEDGSLLFETMMKQAPSSDEATAREGLATYLTQVFGKEVAEGVSSVTNPVQTPAEKRDETLQDKTRAYVAHVAQEVKDNPRALLVKCVGDFFDNAGSLQHTDLPGNETTTFKQAYKYLGCVSVFRSELQKDNPYATGEMREEYLRQLARIEERLQRLLAKHREVASTVLG